MMEKIKKSDVQEIYELDLVQKGMLFHFLKEEDKNLYNVQLALEVSGTLQADVLQKALEKVQAENEVLRSVFRWEEVNKPLQIILKKTSIPFSYHDLSQDQKIDNSKWINDFLLQDQEERFDLNQVPLRLNLVKAGEGSFILVITHHHILYDGWSTGIFLKELFYCYDQINQGEKPVLGTKPLYKEVIKHNDQFKQNAYLQEATNYWKAHLSDYEIIPALLQDDHQEEALAHTLGLSIPMDQVQDFVNKHKVTKAALVYTAYGILLQKYMDTEKVVFGTTVSNRDEMAEGGDLLMGNFINTPPLMIKDLDEKSLLEAVVKVNGELIERRAFNHTSYYEIKQLLGLKPEDELFNSIVVVENYPLDKALINSNEDFTVQLRSVHQNSSIPLVITVYFKEQLEIEFTYHTNVFSPEYIKALSQHLSRILNQIISDPSQKVVALNLPSQEERLRILTGFNDTAQDYPKEKTTVDIFEQQVVETPDNIALVVGDTRVTYKELNALADNIAQIIQAKTSKKKHVNIALLFHPSIEMIASIWGILKAGCAFVPLSPDAPQERNAYILADSDAALLLVQNLLYQENLSDNLEMETEKVLVIEKEKLQTDNGKFRKRKISPEDLISIIYTSGTTGMPKGVKVKHRGVVNFITWKIIDYAVSSEDVTLLMLSYHFDAFAAHLYSPLFTGGTLVLPDTRDGIDLDEVSRIIIKEKVTNIGSTPGLHDALLRGLKEEDAAQMKRIRFITVGGDVTRNNLLENSKKKLPWVQIINEYGPTETTIAVTYLKGLNTENSALIGKPLANTQIYILGRNQEVQPIGLKGEIYIAGDGLTSGYVKNKKLTDEKFVANPFVAGALMYRTGDYGKWLTDGNIEFIGRLDNQVKLRGFRIELGEIEGELLRFAEIKETIVLVREINNTKHLVAYYVASDKLEKELLKNRLTERLPPYMIPNYFVYLDKFPISSNGKINRKLLPEPTEVLSTNHLQASREIEVQLLQIWSEVLGHKNMGINTNFFDAGGDSLKLMLLSTKIKKAFNREVSLTQLFSYPTILSLSNFINPDNPQKKVKAKDRVKTVSESATTDVAVIGMACRFPGAMNVTEFWENLKNGKEGISIRTDSTDDDGLVKAKGALEGRNFFDASFFNYIPNEVHAMDPQVRIFHECAWEALESTGCNPFTYDGAIGLYAGATPNLSFETKVNREHEDWADKWEALTYADKDFMVTRVAYKLNLKGPGVNISTACSTSLVAIDSACNDLLANKCDMALAGGISVTWHDDEGYLYHKDMILSPDGHCRAFDAQAKGTVSGNGVGIVVLKKLDAALRDGDTIYSVIKGTATNNDGNQKVGFTAPSVEGQSRVIQQALEQAGVVSESITYVEAHGTGTTLGDPIEIAGLSKAFDSDKKQFCAIGSVKTNIGHLDAAAGIAGFIKAALCLKNKQMVPSLNFEKPNPNIDFANSPFYVNTHLKEWPKGDYPRRAGVSSFGIGGTNAHIVLEEAPEPADSTESGKIQILSLSGKTPEALVRNQEKLADFLSKENTPALADIAYTLHTGRAHFEYRKSIVCANADEAIQLLTTNSDTYTNEPITGQAPYVVFMFSGQGAQYVNMAAGLYREDAFFKARMDECFEIVQQIAQKDLKSLLFSNQTEDELRAIDQTENTQPLLFVVEYAMARLLINWGLQPSMMLGHSLGEYVAACISGVFSLEDALKLILKRGALMQQVSPGSMLSILIAQKDLMFFLDTNDKISLASVNSTERCVVSGTEADIEAFQKIIEAAGYDSRIIRTSHAFHSDMMDPILEEFQRVVKSVSIHPPQIPFMSNLTGMEVTHAQLSQPDYWSNHLRRTVLFSSSLDRILENEKAIFIEVGPGNTLSSFVLSHHRKTALHQIVSTIRHPKNTVEDFRYLLSALGECWTYGVNPDWAVFYGKEKRQKVALPTYAFEKIAYPDIQTDTIKDITRRESKSITRLKDTSQWFYLPTWKIASPLFQNDVSTGEMITLLFADEQGVSEALVEKFRISGEQLIIVTKAKSFTQNTTTDYGINPNSVEDYDQLFANLSLHKMLPTRIVHAWGLLEETSIDHSKDNFEKTAALYLYSLLYTLQRIAASVKAVVLLTNDLQEVLGNEVTNSLKSLPLGLLKVVGQEYPNVSTAHIDISLQEEINEWFIDQLFKEIRHLEAGKMVALRQRKRWIRIFDKISIESKHPKYQSPVLKKQGVYIITGGLGDLGIALAKYLLEHYEAKVVLTGRTELPATNDTFSSNGIAADQKRKIERLRLLEAIGGKVVYWAGDISDSAKVTQLIEKTEEKFGIVNGLIHAAGVVGDDLMIPLSLLEKSDFDRQMSAKVWGLKNLIKAFSDKALDFCITTSSISTILGGYGFSAYAAANAYMDHVVNSGIQQGYLKNWISLNLDGLNLNGNGGEGINPEEIDQVFIQALSMLNLPQVIVSVGDLNQRLAQVLQPPVSTASIQNGLGLNAANSDDASHNKILATDIDNKMLAIWRQFFGNPAITANDDFFKLGGDSLRALKLIGYLAKELNVNVSVQELFTYPSVNQLNTFLQLEHSGNSSSSPLEHYEAIPKAQEQQYYRLSSMQKRLYFLYEFDKKSTAYNIPITFQLIGQLDRKQLTRAFEKLIRRHESLRTAFVIEGAEPVQQIVEDFNFEIEFFTAEDNEGEILKAFIRPHDLAQAPLIRVGLIQVADEKYILILDMHHIINDGFSEGILVKDFVAFYKEASLPELSLQYKDYAEWEQSTVFQKEKSSHKAFWINKYTTPVETLELPTDFQRPLLKTYHGGALNFELSREHSQKLKSIAKEEGTTMFMLLLAIYNVFLSKLGNQEDITVGTPIVGRQHPDLENIVGMFVNTLVLRNHPQGDIRFREFLAQLVKETLACFDHQDYKYEELIDDLNLERNVSRNPLFDHLFMYQTFEDNDFDIPDLIFKPYENGHVSSMFDLSLSGEEKEGIITLKFEYSTDLFREDTIWRFAAYFKNIVAAVINNIGQRIAEINILPEEEKQQLLYTFNDTAAAYPQEETLISLFEEQVALHPEHIAIQHRGLAISYGELNQRVNKLANHLKVQGVKPGTIVAILLDRSIDCIASILAVLKNTGIYLAIDSDYPDSRINYILHNSETKFLITEEHLVAGKSIEMPAQPIYLDKSRAEIDAYAAGNPENITSQKTNVYLIYTSGTTGNPKGVIGSQQGVINRLYWGWKNYSFGKNEVCCQKTSLSFVDHVAEIFLPLLKGVPLVILDREEVVDIESMCRLLAEHKISRITLVPSLLEALIQEKKSKQLNLDTLKYVFCSGDTLNIQLTQKFYEEFKSVRLINIYGSTEVSADVSYYDVKRLPTEFVLTYFNHPSTMEKHFRYRADKKVTKIDASPGFTTPNVNLQKVKENFKKSKLFDNPLSIEEYYRVLDQDIIPYTINTTAPTFIGHMTSALPYFVHDISKLISELNQNVVKIETSKSITFLEKEAIALLHRMFYAFSNQFYEENTHLLNANLGIVTSGGTSANISAILAARNKVLSQQIKEQNIDPGKSIYSQIQELGYKDMVIIGSRLMHYSFKKALNLLGLGMENVIYIKNDHRGVMDTRDLQLEIDNCRNKQLLILAIVGIAGSTERGSIDPLEEIATVARHNNIHFHVDAAWGGALVFSDRYKHLLRGVEQADSITICGHKQLFLPQGISVCLFKDQKQLNYNSTTANYQAQPDTYDFGRFTIEGSRPALSICLHATLRILGKKGYELLIDKGIANAMLLAELIQESDGFELISQQMNIVNYRYIPIQYRSKSEKLQKAPEAIEKINKINFEIQENQFYKGKTFVSKTTIKDAFNNDIVVFRAVLSNPLTTPDDLVEVLNDHVLIIEELYEEPNRAFVYKDQPVAEEYGIKKMERSVPIGKPLDNTQIMILGKSQELLPVGVAGEIWISGDGVTPGYLNSPELTEAKIFSNPYYENTLMYRTGDIGQWTSDGDVEFLGRVDDQIKIRGHRIEPGEVECHLTAHERITEALVLAKDSAGDKYLVGYYVASEELNSSELRSFLSNKLPEYMIPTYFVFLDRIPLSPNGKLDKKALPAPEIKMEEDHLAPTNATEKTLVKIWAEVLKVDEKVISINKNFFELGGHSIRAVHLLHSIRQYFGVNIEMRKIFDHLTIQKLSKLIQSLERENTHTIPQVNKQEYYPASPAQERIYYKQLLDKDSTFFNISGVFKIKNQTEVSRLRKAFQDLIERHDVLRTSFYLKDGKVVQQIREDSDFELVVWDHSKEDSDIRKLFNDFIQAFDLSQKSLIRSGLLLTKEKESILFIDIHHIICDGLSLNILIRDFNDLYQGKRLSPVPLRYVDYAVWQSLQNGSIKVQEDFWQAQLSNEWSRLELPVTQSRDAVDIRPAFRKMIKIKKEQYQQIKAYTRSNNISDFMFLLSVFYTFLHKITGNADIVIGTDVVGRTKPELHDMVGSFVNILPLRLSVEPNDSYHDFLTEVKECVLNAFEHQAYQFDQMVAMVDEEEEVNRNPIFDVHFSFANTLDSEAELQELDFVPFEIDREETTEYEFKLEVKEDQGVFEISFVCSSALYDEDTVEVFMTYYYHILNTVLKNDTIALKDIALEVSSNSVI